MLGRVAALDRLLDRAAHHELMRHDAHGLRERHADDRLTHARRQAPKEGGDVIHRQRLESHDATGQHQSPGRGVNEQRMTVTEVPVPLPAGELVANEAIGGVGIGNAQERFRQAHQHHAFLRRQVVLVHEGIEAAVGLAPRAHRQHQLAGAIGNTPARVVGNGRLREQGPDARGLVGEEGRIDRRAQRTALRKFRGKDHAWLTIPNSGVPVSLRGSSSVLFRLCPGAP